MNLIFKINLKKIVFQFNSSVCYYNNTFNFSRSLFNSFHKFHILNYSLWPFCLSLGFFSSTVGMVIFFHYNSILLFFLSFIQILLISYFWSSDIIEESLEHTFEIRSGIRLGMILFIVSEIMFFFSIFWAFFYLSISPAVELGCSWPPVGLGDLIIDFSSIPFLNTIILLFSGVLITCAHELLDSSSVDLYNKLFKLFSNYELFSILKKLVFSNFFFDNFSSFCLIIFNFFVNKLYILMWLMGTLFLALTFTLFQIFEYIEANFFISDGSYGSTFFLSTGFHGFHILVGSVLLLISSFRVYLGQFDDIKSVGLECAIWYWHFVDVVWLFLYVFLYFWGSISRTGGFFVLEKFIIIDFINY